MTECPKCGGELYDNTAKAADGWKGPLFKCKDPACDYRKWAPKSATKAASGRGPKWTWKSLYAAWSRCYKLAEARLVDASKVGPKLAFTQSDVLAAAATLFIAASRDGVEDAAPKAAPEPLDQPPAALAAAKDDDDLPF